MKARIPACQWLISPCTRASVQCCKLQRKQPILFVSLGLTLKSDIYSKRFDGSECLLPLGCLATAAVYDICFVCGQLSATKRRNYITKHEKWPRNGWIFGNKSFKKSFMVCFLFKYRTPNLLSFIYVLHTANLHLSPIDLHLICLLFLFIFLPVPPTKQCCLHTQHEPFSISIRYTILQSASQCRGEKNTFSFVFHRAPVLMCNLLLAHCITVWSCHIPFAGTFGNLVRWQELH